MNKLTANLQQVHKSGQAVFRQPAAVLIHQFQSQQGIRESVETACFSYQFLSTDLSHLELRTMNFDSANDKIRIKLTSMGSFFLRDITQEMIQLMSRIKETLLGCVCAFSIRRNTKYPKRTTCIWIIDPERRQQTDNSMINILSMCIESQSIQRLMGNTSFVV